MKEKTEVPEEKKTGSAASDVLPEGEAGITQAEGEERIPEPVEEVSLIYLGPNLRSGRLLQSTVFRGGVPEHLKPLLDEQPDLVDLIVPVDKISDVQARIAQAGTLEHVAYQAVLKGGV